MEECQNILEIRNLKKSYMINKENSLQVLKGLNISIGSGEMVALMGASGCGKTTLINLICGIDKADSGSIMIDHEEITKMRRSKMAVFRRNNIGLIFQDFNLLESLNVKDNILLPLILENRIEDSEEKLKQIAEVLSIADIMGKSVTDISGGQKQRVAIARALINTPQIILADEPTGSVALVQHYPKIIPVMLLSRSTRISDMTERQSVRFSSRVRESYMLLKSACSIISTAEKSGGVSSGASSGIC